MMYINEILVKKSSDIAEFNIGNMYIVNGNFIINKKEIPITHCKLFS